MKNHRGNTDPVTKTSPKFKVVLFVLAVYIIGRFIMSIIKGAELGTLDYVSLAGGIGCIVLILSDILKKNK
ncbi:hypothetical protein ACFQZ1_09625 [Bacillus sp. CGMCC 1.60114]|uniref:hypothetical protein n=1 Tax=unclassified Bacillus (in: firmicutes) TaxID=185979 RepID=UPI00362EDF1C